MVDLIAPMMIENRLTLPSESFRDAALGFFVARDNGRLEYINAEAARIFGFVGIEDALKYSLHDIETTVNCGLADCYNTVMKGKSIQKYDHRCTNRQGHYAVLNISCSPFREDGGRISGIFGIIQDITESYQKKVKLEEAGYVLSVISQVSEALSSTAELDEVLHIILTGVTANQGLGFNRAFLFLLNGESNCLEGKIAIGPNNRAEAHEIWTRLAGQHKTLLELLDDYRIGRDTLQPSISSKIENWIISLNESSIFADSLNIERGLNVSRDPALSKESLEILDRLRTDNLAVAPIISRGKKLGLIAADNQITGERITDSRVELLQTFANNSAVAIEHSQLIDRLLDRTRELEKINHQLAESQEQIIRAEKMSVIGELTSSIAHELRNPLMIIGGFANMMISSGKVGDDGEYLNIILSETERAESVLHQVLDFSRASRTSSREIDFNVLVRKAYDYFQSKTRFKQKNLKLDLADESLMVWGNPDQLLHVILQFIRLTVDEMVDECSTHIETGLENGHVKLRVGFDGNDDVRSKAGETLNRIFGSSTGTQKLSLIVAGETIKYHGGNYGIESSGDDGPGLYLELPYLKEMSHD